MKRFNLFLILLVLASCAWAQTKYTERLDSIVTDFEYGRTVKYVFHYDEEGRLAERLFYAMWDGKWTNREQRLYSYDENGRVVMETNYSLDEKNVEPSREQVEYDDMGRISLWKYEQERDEWYVPTWSGIQK